MGDTMLREKRKIGFILVGAMLLTLAGCKGGGKAHDILEKYYLVTPNTKLAYFQAAYKGFSNAMNALGVKWRGPRWCGPDKYDPQAQVQNFQDAVAAKPAGILVAPADSQLMAPEIDRAISLGIPVITIDSDSPASKRLTFIGTNNRAAGAMAAERVAKKLNGAGQIVIFTILNQENTKERMLGVESVLSNYKYLKSIETVDIKGDATIAFDTATRLVEKRKQDIDGFLCLEAVSCKEVADVLDRAGVKGKLVVGFDTDGQTLDWIERGMIDATIAQKPYTMGFLGAMMLGDLVLDKPPSLNIDFATDFTSPVPKFVDTGTVLIDGSNIAEFRKAQNPQQGTGATE